MNMMIMEIKLAAHRRLGNISIFSRKFANTKISIIQNN